MTWYWEVIAPVAIAGLGMVVFLAARLSRPAGAHAAGPWRPGPAETEPVPAPEYGSMIWAEEQDLAACEPVVRLDVGGWISGPSLDVPLEEDEWTDRLLADLHDAPTALDDLGPGAGLYLSPGYNSRLPSPGVRMKADSPAPDDLPREDGAGDEPEASGPPAPPAPPVVVPMEIAEWPTWAEAAPPAPLWEYHAQNPDLAGGTVQLPTRLLKTTGELLNAELLAECTTFMARQDAEVAVWLAGASERWAAT